VSGLEEDLLDRLTRGGVCDMKETRTLHSKYGVWCRKLCVVCVLRVRGQGENERDTTSREHRAERERRHRWRPCSRERARP
jgi:hypothetical protein